VFRFKHELSGWVPRSKILNTPCSRRLLETEVGIVVRQRNVLVPGLISQDVFKTLIMDPKICPDFDVEKFLPRILDLRKSTRKEILTFGSQPKQKDKIYFSKSHFWFPI
jgi:hypothetical protein